MPGNSSCKSMTNCCTIDFPHVSPFLTAGDHFPNVPVKSNELLVNRFERLILRLPDAGFDALQQYTIFF